MKNMSENLKATYNPFNTFNRRVFIEAILPQQFEILIQMFLLAYDVELLDSQSRQTINRTAIKAPKTYLVNL